MGKVALVVQFILFCAWPSVDRSGSQMVTAQPTTSAWIVTPEAGRKEGGTVRMRCTATNLESSQHVEWALGPNTLRWDNYTITLMQRFTYETIFMTQPTRGITQDMIIAELQREDTEVYVCNVHDLTINSGDRIVSSQSVQLSVFYFPNESFPVCFPSGPIAVDAGTNYQLQCLSDAGNSAISMAISPISATSTNYQYAWNMSNIDNNVTWSLNLTLNAVHNNITFECVISSEYFDSMQRSCTMGPINVMGPDQPGTPASNTAITAGATVGGVVALILLILILTGLRKTNTCFRIPKPTTHQETEPSPVNDMPSRSQVHGSFTNEYAEAGFQIRHSTSNDQPRHYHEPDQPVTVDSHHELHAQVVSNSRETDLAKLTAVTSDTYPTGPPEARINLENVSNQQGLDNFETDDTKRDTPELSTAGAGSEIKPIADAQLKRPALKPKPYQTRPQHQISCDDNNQQCESLQIHAWDGQIQPATTAYASVSVPTKHNSTSPNPKSHDVVYADLDFCSQTSED